MGNFFRKNKLELLLFIFVFLILAFFASKTFLFYDDITFSFPSVTKDYLNFYNNYLRDWGLFRPLAWIYYFFIYEIFARIPNLTHLIPLFFSVFASFLFFKILVHQGLHKNHALALGILFSVSPLVVESFSWLSANTSIMVILIFFLQIYLIESDIFKKNLTRNILFLQLISTFLYETTIFMPFALGYLLFTKNKARNKIKLVLFSIMPLLAYLISKIAIKPLLQHRDKLINLSEMISSWISSLQHLRIMLSADFLYNFWGKELSNGLNLISSNIFVAILFSIFIFSLTIVLFNKKNNQLNATQTDFKDKLKFWVFCFILSLIPLSWHPAYQPFRTLTLPFITLIISIYFFFRLIFKDNKIISPVVFLLKFSLISIIITFLLIQISMIDQYAIQYSIDQKIVLEIDQKLEDSGFEHPYRTNLLLKNFMNNNVERMIYGDYIYGLFSRHYTAEALLDLNSGSFAKVGIEIPSDNAFSAKISKAEFLKLRPLTIMSFTNDKSCLNGECLKVEAVYQNKY